MTKIEYYYKDIRKRQHSNMDTSILIQQTANESIQKYFKTMLEQNEKQMYTIKISNLREHEIDNKVLWCNDCNKPLLRKNSIFCICIDCGLEMRDEADHCFASNDFDKSICYSSSTLRIKGFTREARAQNNRLMGCTSAMRDTKKQKILAFLQSKIFQIRPGADTIPQHIINDVADTYSYLQIKEKLVKRAGGLEGVLSALLYNSCIEHNIPRKPHTITEIMGVSGVYLSMGDKVLRTYACNPTISLPNGYGSDDAFINQYFEKLNINKYDKYKPFITELIEETQLEKIPIKDNNTRPTTRIAGALFILVEELGLEITRDDVARECSISKSTITRYINLVNTYKNKKEIADLFAKYFTKD